MTAVPQDAPADTFAAVARDLLAEETVELTLGRLVALAVNTIEPCEAAGVSIARRGAGRRQHIDTAAATGPDVQRAHELQDRLYEGPSWDAIWQRETVVVEDLANEGRWPRWGPLVVRQLGFRSVLSLRLYNTRNTLGSLNLYSSQPSAFDEETTTLGRALATHGAVALTGSQDSADLTVAAATRLVIGQAEGVLMERLGVSVDQAFGVLRHVSSTTNRKLRDVASDVVAGAGPVRPPV